MRFIISLVLLGGIVMLAMLAFEAIFMFFAVITAGLVNGILWLFKRK